MLIAPSAPILFDLREQGIGKHRPVRRRRISA